MKQFTILLLTILAAICLSTDLPKTNGEYDQCVQDTTENNLAINVSLKYDSLLKVSHKEKVIVGIKNQDRYDYYKLSFDDYSSIFAIVCAGKDVQLIFANKGFVTKRININTSDAPASFWKGGFYMEMDIAMVEQPENFDDSITEIPLGIANYNAEKNTLSFDAVYSVERKAALDDAIARAKTSSPKK